MYDAPSSWYWVTEISCVIFCLAVLAGTIALIFIALKIKGIVSKISGQIQPIGTKVEGIVDSAGQTADKVTERVDEATNLFREQLLRPLVSLVSLGYGIVKGIEAWQEIRRKEPGKEDAQE